MKKTVIFLLCFGAASAQAQHKNILISTNYNPNEMSIALDEKDLNQQLAAANIASVYTSQNGGVSWKTGLQTSTYGVWGDPVVAVDTAGAFYHFHLSRPEEDGSWIDRIVCQKSTDRGNTFNNGTFTGLNGGKAQDKHWVAIDRNTNTLYLTWTQFDKYDSEDPEDRSNILFSKSEDGGETWSEPVKINSVSGDCLDDDNTVEGAVPAIGPSGEIYVSWAGPLGIVFNKSEDGGETWLEKEIEIDEMPGGWSIDIPGILRANGMPVTKCDISGGDNHGTIYVNWADQRNGIDDTDIWLAKSTDSGESWSEPIRVNQDTVQNQQFFTWMDIDQTNGNLYFVYHDRRNHDDISTDVFLAVSTDGGNTFTETMLSDSAFIPNDKVFFGDYNNIAAHNGVVRPVWTRLDGKDLSVYTALVDTDLILNPYNDGIEVLYDAGTSTISVSGLSAVLTKIQLTDINGKPIARWNEDEKVEKSNHFKLKSELAEGVYYVEIGVGSEKLRRPLIVVKN
ncbi:MAG: glycoside hydrolase [Flavobacteriales bacterium]|nr:glycoside hydrolase [Flavobacteriales bacterium]